MAFIKKTWVNVPDPSSLPLIPEGQDALARFDAENMNRIEGGISDAIAHMGEKSNPHSVTAEQVGAVPKSGGTFSGDISIIKSLIPSLELGTNKSFAHISKNASDTEDMDDGLLIKDCSDSSDQDSSVYLRLCHRAAKISPADALKIAFLTEGEGEYYNIFGEHNADALGVPRIQTGTYTGTGKRGSSNPNTLTFDFDPTLIIIAEVDNKGNDPFGFHMTLVKGAYKVNPLGGSGGVYSYITWGDKSVSWYSSGGNETSEYQFNTSGKTYRYIAICYGGEEKVHENS